MDAPKKKRKKKRLQRCKRFPAKLYTATFEKKKVVPGKFVILFIGPKSELPHAQLGIVTSSKTLKTAVARNRARRLMREAFRKEQKQFKPGARVLLLARKEIVEGKASMKEVAADLKKICDRARLVVAPPPPPKPKKPPPKPKPKHQQPRDGKTFAQRFGRYQPPKFAEPAPRDFFNPLY